MSVPATADDFLCLVRKSGIVEPPALDDYMRALGDQTPHPGEPKRLARAMIHAGLITNLQAGLLMRGKWRNFDIAGKYRLLELLGSGGMGQVYLCEHARMRRRVAIKVLPLDKAEDEVLVQRFEREARAVAALDHPNIVRAHDLDHDGRLHFLVMEYVDGASLEAIVSGHGPLSVERACNYVRQAALGLQHAHEADLVHRDIKAANLLLDSTGLVKILDLGLARFFHDEQNLTRQFGQGHLVGTPDYLAPEQATNSHTVDIRADIYSLGVTFYFLLTGQTPFGKGTVAERLQLHQVQVPDAVRLHRPDVPEVVSRAIARMLAKDAVERFQTPADVVAILDPWTTTPIPPPPVEEMPKLSRAARRHDTPMPPLAVRADFHVPPAPVVPPTRRAVGWLLIAAIGACLGAAVWCGLSVWDHARTPAVAQPVGTATSDADAN